MTAPAGQQLYVPIARPMKWYAGELKLGETGAGEIRRVVPDMETRNDSSVATSKQVMKIVDLDGRLV